ncbi:acyltransferase family protein [Sphingomonas sp.]|uniref:acyltransferase family protein n=1 Tax=Sphingomonas sp. TaxID=28214 RepID=UPI0035BBAE9C
MEPAPDPQRHYGLDWLRIGAFAALIFYHVGMVFVPWNFHVKSTHIAAWLTLPMLATNAWRLTLLFVVSGYASRALLARYPAPGRFAANRSARLLVPLAFGMILIVPPQPWVELVTRHGYDHGLASFWLRDYWRFSSLDGVALPTWNHLWFVGYLWVYTLILAVGVSLMRSTWLQRVFDRVFSGWWLLILPTAWFALVHGSWFTMVGETHALVGDGIAHASYLPAFLFGFALAGSPAVLAATVRLWKPAAALALLGYAAVLAFELSFAAKAWAASWGYRPYGVAHAVQQWGTIVALIGVAERYWNHDAAIRPMLTEAVFPFYIVHQTIIVVVMYWLLGAGLPGWAEFAILVAATVAGCWAFYLGGRAVPRLRPLIGLRQRQRPAVPALL